MSSSFDAVLSESTTTWNKLKVFNDEIQWLRNEKLPISSCQFNGNVEFVVRDFEQSIKRAIYASQTMTLSNLVHGTKSHPGILEMS
jgi:hypothetical protein